MMYYDKKPLKHVGAPDSDVDPHIIERLDLGCQIVAGIISEMGPPPPPEHEWAAWEVRPAFFMGNNKAGTFETDYDHLIQGNFWQQAKSGQLVRLCLFAGHDLIPYMRRIHLGQIADYIEEIRNGTRIVVFEIGNPKGCYVRALGVLPMQRGGQS